MLLASLIRWWYGPGYVQQIKRVQDVQARLADSMSVAQLAATLFAPFKQIDAGHSQASVPLGVKFRFWFDRLFSRMFGAAVRSITIVFGLVFLGVWALIGLVKVVLWPLVPLLPLVALFLVSADWLPWK